MTILILKLRYVEFHNVIRNSNGFSTVDFIFVFDRSMLSLKMRLRLTTLGDEMYFYRQACRREKLRLSCKYRSLARISFRVNVALNRSLTSALSGRSSWSAVGPDDARINVIR